MKLLYPEIDTWVYNMQKTDPSINVSITLGDVKDVQGHVPPSIESCHSTWRGPNCYFFVPPLQVRQTDLRVSLPNAFTLAEARASFTVWDLLHAGPTHRGARVTKHDSPLTSSRRRDYSPPLHALTQDIFHPHTSSCIWQQPSQTLAIWVLPLM